MAVCACPQGIIRRDCEYHQDVARRFLENLNTPKPAAPRVTGTFARGGITKES